MNDAGESSSCILPQPQAILLDMDGVLADVRHSYRTAILETVRSFGVQLESAEIAAAKRRGNANNDWELSRQLLKDRGVDVDLEQVTACFEAMYQGEGGREGLHLKETLIPSRSMLSRLAGRCKLAIVTGRPRKDAYRFLQRFEIQAFFFSIVCLEDAIPKPDPSPAQLAISQLEMQPSRHIWMVGDTPDDMVCAIRAKIAGLGIVAPGDDSTTTQAVLLQSGATQVLRSLEQLVEMTR